MGGGFVMIGTEYTAELRAPNGERLTYTVTAFNKTQARRKVAERYREDTPAPRHGFYSFQQQKLTWVTDAD